MTSIFRGPVLSSLRRPRTSAHLGTTVAVNLLLTTLAIAPFAQKDWPNPITRAFAQEVGYVSGTIPQDVPFTPGDWPNPPAPRPTDLGYVQGANALEVPMPSDAPLLPFDWPNPRTYRPLNLGFTEDIFRNPADVGFPFSKTEWPNPTTYRYKELGYTAGIRPPDELPLCHTEWPNPQKARPRNLGFTSDIFRNPADPGFPFSQEDWPNPRPDEPTDLGHTRRARIQESAIPFQQTEWPNPQVRRRFDASYSLELYTGSVPQVIAPFSQLDWPNPIERDSQSTPLGHTSDIFRNPSDPGSPFSQKYWPNPVYATTFDLYSREYLAPTVLLYSGAVVQPPDETEELLEIEGGLPKAIKRQKRGQAKRIREEAIAARQAVEAAEAEIKRIRDQNELIAVLGIMLIP